MTLDFVLYKKEPVKKKLLKVEMVETEKNNPHFQKKPDYFPNVWNQ